MDNEVVRLAVTVHDRAEAMAPLHDGVVCTGAVARCLKRGNLRVYLAGATLIATGGYGRLYRETTNAVINDGAGPCSPCASPMAPSRALEAAAATRARISLKATITTG
jgi:fumarate reductase flavoprotein subunit